MKKTIISTFIFAAALVSQAEVGPNTEWQDVPPDTTLGSVSDKVVKPIIVSATNDVREAILDEATNTFARIEQWSDGDYRILTQGGFNNEKLAIKSNRAELLVGGNINPQAVRIQKNGMIEFVWANNSLTQVDPEISIRYNKEDGKTGLTYDKYNENGLPNDTYNFEEREGGGTYALKEGIPNSISNVVTKEYVEGLGIGGRGNVESVNGKTGIVELVASDVGAIKKINGLDVDDRDNTQVISLTNKWGGFRIENGMKGSEIRVADGSDLDDDYEVFYLRPAGDDYSFLSLFDNKIVMMVDEGWPSIRIGSNGGYGDVFIYPNQIDVGENSFRFEDGKNNSILTYARADNTYLKKNAIDPTLSVTNMAADAKVVGTELSKKADSTSLSRYIPYTMSIYGHHNALTIGSRSNGSSVGENSVVIGSDGHASSYYSRAYGRGSAATGEGAVADGISASAYGSYSHALGNNTFAAADGTFALGNYAKTYSDGKYAFVWQGVDTTTDYFNHGKGSFNINPVGGLRGFWIGETNLAEHLAGITVTTNGLRSITDNNVYEFSPDQWEVHYDPNDELQTYYWPLTDGIEWGDGGYGPYRWGANVISIEYDSYYIEIDEPGRTDHNASELNGRVYHTNTLHHTINSSPFTATRGTWVKTDKVYINDENLDDAIDPLREKTDTITLGDERGPNMFHGLASKANSLGGIRPGEETITYQNGKWSLRNEQDGELLPIASTADIPPQSDGAARPLPKYLHELDFADSYPLDAEDWYERMATNALGGACSAMRSGGNLRRNYDWIFDDAAEFVVKMSAGVNRLASVGVASLGSGLTETEVTSGKWSKKYRALPGMTLDGINEKSVVAEINVDGGPTNGWHGTGANAIHILAAVRWVLDHGTNAATAAASIADRIQCPTSGMNFHFMVADASETWIVENGAAYDVTTNNWKVLTNFALFDDEHAGGGKERYDILTNGSIPWDAVNFTHAYEEGNDWDSDFESPEQHVEAIAQWGEQGKDKESHRGKTTEGGAPWWQTVHSSIYDFAAKTLKVAVQEETDFYTFQVPNTVKESGGGTVNVGNYAAVSNAAMHVNLGPVWQKPDAWGIRYRNVTTSREDELVSTETNDNLTIYYTIESFITQTLASDCWAVGYDLYSGYQPVITKWQSFGGSTIDPTGRLTAPSNGWYTVMATDQRGTTAAKEVPIQVKRYSNGEAEVTYVHDVDGCDRDKINNAALLKLQTAEYVDRQMSSDGRLYDYWDCGGAPAWCEQQAGYLGNNFSFAIGDHLMLNAAHYNLGKIATGAQLVGTNVVYRQKAILLSDWAVTNGWTQAQVSRMNISDIALVPCDGDAIPDENLPYLMSEATLKRMFAADMKGINAWCTTRDFSTLNPVTITSAYGDSWNFHNNAYMRSKNRLLRREDINNVMASHGIEYDIHEGDSGHPIFIRIPGVGDVVLSLFHYESSGSSLVKGFEVIKNYCELNGIRIRELTINE